MRPYLAESPDALKKAADAPLAAGAAIFGTSGDRPNFQLNAWQIKAPDA